MVTRAWKVYGADGHRQKASFGSSGEAFTVDRHDYTATIKVQNSDITGTNDYSIIIITAPDRNRCSYELYAQICDGVFENCRVGKIEIYYDIIYIVIPTDINDLQYINSFDTIDQAKDYAIKLQKHRKTLSDVKIVTYDNALNKVLSTIIW